MKLKVSEAFFNFLFDKNTTRLQIRFILVKAAPIHLKSIVEIVFNLLENKLLKLPLSVKRDLKGNKRILAKFTSSKNLSVPQKVLETHYRLIFSILQKSKRIIFEAIHQ